MIRIDMHLHSERSFDSQLKIEKAISVAKRKGLGGFFLADHNKISSLEQRADFIVLPATEVITDRGHILVYFPKTDFLSKLQKIGTEKYAFSDVLTLAREENALIFAAHPYAPVVERPEGFWDEIDGIEVFNARIQHSRIKDANTHAVELCEQKKKLFSVGSDAHFAGEIGFCYGEFDRELSEENLADKIREDIEQKRFTIKTGNSRGVYRPMGRIISAVYFKKYNLIPKHILQIIYTFFKDLKR